MELFKREEQSGEVFERDIVQELESSYLDYAMSVIVSRALPDVRDGLKPVHRRILYAMHELGLYHSSKFRKSATVVWEVLWKYHPHGDSAVYDALVRMAQDFSLRYPLIWWQGNFWSLDGDSAAAMRYTEVKMQKLTQYMLFDIEKETVEFRDNYDATRKEPVVLPTRVCQILLNGVMGIAVGMATNIPPHNMKEIIDAMNYLLQSNNQENVSIEDLMQYVRGPDFPTWGIVYDTSALLRAYSTGRGSVIVRGAASIEEGKWGKQYIRIFEIPYGVNKAVFIEKIAELVKDKKILGVQDIRDESNKLGIRIMIELKKEADPQKVLNQLYKLTQLQTTFAYNMIALWERGMQPKLYNLKEILIEFIEHRKEVVIRRTEYEKRIVEMRIHILEWLKIALDHIDEVIAIIRSSYDDAEKRLMERFWLSAIQAEAIVEMKLRRLQGLEREKIEQELHEKILYRDDLEDILLRRDVRVPEIIIQENEEIRALFSDERRTKIVPWKPDEINMIDLVSNDEYVILVTKRNYIKKILLSVFKTQRRWGKGTITQMKEDDEIQTMISTKNCHELFFLTTFGRVFRFFVYEIQEYSKQGKGYSLMNLFSIEKGESIACILDIHAEKNEFLVCVTIGGGVKRMEWKEMRNIRNRGTRILSLKEGDKLLSVKTTSWKEQIFLVTKQGKCIIFPEEQVRVMGKAASGVRGIAIKEDDEVIHCTTIDDTAQYILVFTEKGMGKVSLVSEYRAQNRWGSGIKVMNINEKTGNIVFVSAISQATYETWEILLVSMEGQAVRIPLKEVTVRKRVSQGVILAKLKSESDKFVYASILLEE